MVTCGILICSVFSLMVSGQDTAMNQVLRRNPQTGEQAGGVVSDLPGSQGDETPRTWQDLVTRGNGVHDVEDFMRLLTKPDGTPVTENDIFSPYQTEDGKRVITGGGLMATSDECSPRNMSVRLPLDYSDNQIAYYPECTMVQRCGGCCPTQFLSCEPLYKEKIVLKVLRARYLYPGAFHMQWEGFSSVEVERHLSCHAVCRLNHGDCGPKKEFIEHQCKCQCRQFQRCNHDQKWDDNTCSCRCQNARSCCSDDEDERTCVMYFDHDFCECTLKEAIGASPNATQEEIEAWLASRGRSGQSVNHNANYPLPPTTPPTTTTTTTTTTTEPADPCGHLQCPRNFMKIRNASGRCVCTFRFPRPRFPRRG